MIKKSWVRILPFARLFSLLHLDLSVEWPEKGPSMISNTTVFSLMIKAAYLCTFAISLKVPYVKFDFDVSVRNCLLSTQSYSTLGTHLHAMIRTHHFDFDIRFWPVSTLKSIILHQSWIQWWVLSVTYAYEPASYKPSLMCLKLSFPRLAFRQFHFALDFFLPFCWQAAARDRKQSSDQFPLILKIATKLRKYYFREILRNETFYWLILYTLSLADPLATQPSISFLWNNKMCGTSIRHLKDILLRD